MSRPRDIRSSGTDPGSGSPQLRRRAAYGHDCTHCRATRHHACRVARCRSASMATLEASTHKSPSDCMKTSQFKAIALCCELRIVGWAQKKAKLVSRGAARSRPPPAQMGNPNKPADAPSPCVCALANTAPACLPRLPHVHPVCLPRAPRVCKQNPPVRLHADAERNAQN